MTRRTLRLLVILTLSRLVGPLAAEVQSAGNIARIGVLDLGHSSPAAVELGCWGAMEQRTGLRAGRGSELTSKLLIFWF
jgi:hypothetical protein